MLAMGWSGLGCFEWGRLNVGYLGKSHYQHLPPGAYVICMAPLGWQVFC